MTEQILNPKFVNNKYTIQLYEPQNKLGLVTQVFNSALGEAEAGSYLWAQGQSTQKIPGAPELHRTSNQVSIKTKEAQNRSMQKLK